MLKNILFIASICMSLWGCTLEKTDYEADIGVDVEENPVFKEIARQQSQGYDVILEALDGSLLTGYNDIRLKVLQHSNQAVIHPSMVTMIPINTKLEGDPISCPHLYRMEQLEDDPSYEGYLVFPLASTSSSSWDLYINIEIEGQDLAIRQTVQVLEQKNKNLNMTSFIGKDDVSYYIALVSPKKPKVGENELVAGIYRHIPPANTSSTLFPDPDQYVYAAAEGYTLKLDPRMPEPSMGNHSSPNNVDLTQRDNGLYYGVVNYTMTGNWTLNFIMLDAQGNIIRGTEVPKDFTPGVEGEKGELHIDTLF